MTFPRPLGMSECVARRPVGGTITAALVGALTFAVAQLGAAGSTTAIAFNVPAGNAITTLTQFAVQSGEQIVFSTDEVDGVRTRAVRGRMPPAQALTQMLTGTALTMSHDEKTGAIAVGRAASPKTPKSEKEGGRRAPDSVPPAAAKETAMSNNASKPSSARGAQSEPRSHWYSLILAAVASVGVQPSTSAAAADEPIVLNPFEVTSTKDTGYQASSTLAGTRLNTPLSDIGAPVTVITREFLEDTGVTDLSSLLIYTPSGEAGGLGGNFSATISDGNIPTQDDVRRRPDEGTRVRGLQGSPADRTRDYFLTDLPIESYNVERVDMSRGPNSMLFGLGSPAGVVNTTLIKPFYGRNAYTAQLRYGAHESFRSTIDANQVLIPQKLAARVALLDKETHWQQNPTFERDKRVFATVKVNPFKDTTMSAHYEAGEIKARRPLTISPAEKITTWFLAGKPTWDASLPASATNVNPIMNSTIDPRFNNPGSSLFAQPAIFAGFAIPFEANGQAPMMAGFQGQRTATETVVSTGAAPSPLFWYSPAHISNFVSGYGIVGAPVSVFDFRKQLISGESGYTQQALHAANVTLEQHFLRRQVGIELAYDQERLREFFYEAFGVVNPNSFNIDPNTKLLDGRVNPNFGRPYIVDNDGSGRRYERTKREAFRATAYGKFNFAERFPHGVGRWLGRHTGTGFFSSQSYNQDWHVLKHRFGGDQNFQILQDNITSGTRGAMRIIYIGPSLANLASFDQARLDFNLTAAPLEIGDTYDITHWNRNTGTFTTDKYPVVGTYSNAVRQRKDIDAQSFVLQSYWLADNIVTVFGWRRDEAKGKSANVLPRLPDGSVDLGRVTTDYTSPDVNGEIKSHSLVGKLPPSIKLPFGIRLSAHYSKSENFQPIVGQVNVFGRPIPPPKGKTREHGFTLSSRDERTSLRLNWYRTYIKDARSTDVGATLFNSLLQLDFQTAQFWYDGLANRSPGVTQANIDRLIGTVPDSIKQSVGYTPITRPDGIKTINYTIPNNLSDTTNFKAVGFEGEGTLNPTPNWRIAVNVARQQTQKDNTGPYVTDLFNQRLPIWTELGEIARNPTVPNSATLMNEVNRLVTNPILSLHLRDGVYSAELRKWRINLVNNYTFGDESRLKGFGVGGAWRWQSGAAMGYPSIIGPNSLSMPDIAHPYLTPSTSDFDLWISYGRPLFNRKVRWKLQLNVGNVFADNEVIAVKLITGGAAGMWRATPPRTWSLTSTFRM